MRFHSTVSYAALLVSSSIIAGCATSNDEMTESTSFTLPEEIMQLYQPPPPPPVIPPKPHRKGVYAKATKIDASTVYEWEPDRLFPINTGIGNHTIVQLGKGEFLSKAPLISSPDISKWIIEYSRGASDFVVIRCGERGSKNNLFITTSTHDYQLSMKCLGRGGMNRVRWTYPEPEKPTQTPPPQPVFDPNTFSRAFEITNPSNDHPTWTPTGVYENSGKTFIEFPAKLGPMVTAPVLLNPKGGDIQFRVTGGHFYEIDQAVTDAELRLDNSVIRIRRKS